jgi:membrane dipeptidase
MKILFFTLLTSILFISCHTSKKTNSEIHSDILTIDTHIDIPLRLMRDSTYNLAVEHNSKKGQTDFPRMTKGGLDAAFFIVWTPQEERDSIGNKNVNEKAHKIIEKIKLSVNSSPSLAELAYSSDDIIRINNSKKHPILIGMENGYPIGSDISQVELFYNLGIRYLTLCHTKDNDICDSSTDETKDEGVTNFGVEVITEVNRLGIIIDVSHISDSSFYNVMELSKVPVIASHSNVRSLCNHPRNMSDDMIKLLAKNGGVIHINFVDEYAIEPEKNAERDSAIAKIKSQFVSSSSTDEERKIFRHGMDEINKEFPTKSVTLKDVIDHIDYVVKLVGINHVGIGSDFDGGGRVVGLEDVSKLGNITTELLKRGYTEDDIQKIWSGNFMRVFKEVESFASTD